MPHWVIKSALQRGISWLPNSQFWNGQFQRWVTKSTILTMDSLRGKLEESRRMLEPIIEIKGPGAQFTSFEIGTGWYPIIPVALYLCGAERTWTTDIDPLLNRSRVERLFRMLVELDSKGELTHLLPEALPERIAKIKELASLAGQEDPEPFLAKINIHVLSCDARKTPLEDHSIDLFFSSGVLEYIPRSILEEILQEAIRLSTPDFVSIHRLNLVDQFSYFDKSITPFNFLKFSPRKWQWANSPLIWQNRLRISDYRNLFSEQGFDVIHEANISGESADLAKVPLAPEFQAYSEADLLVLHSYITARPSIRE